MTYSVNFANYTIGKEAYKNVNEVCRQYGTKALLIGGKLALEAGKEKLLQALAEGENPVTIVDTVLFGEDCTYAGMEKIAAHVKKCGADMIFGMGGGKALDTAKGTAENAVFLYLLSRRSRQPARRRRPFQLYTKKMEILTVSTSMTNRRATALLTQRLLPLPRSATCGRESVIRWENTLSAIFLREATG